MQAEAAYRLPSPVKTTDKQPPSAAAAQVPIMLVTKMAALAVLFLVFAFWVIFLAGVADWQAKMDGSGLSLHWWIVFFELLCIIFALAVAFGGAMLARFHHTVVVFFAIVTALLMYVASTAVSAANDRAGDSSGLVKAYRTTAAGAVTLSILNLVYLIFATGWGEHWAAEHHAAGAATTGHHHNKHHGHGQAVVTETTAGAPAGAPVTYVQQPGMVQYAPGHPQYVPTTQYVQQPGAAV